MHTTTWATLTREGPRLYDDSHLTAPDGFVRYACPACGEPTAITRGQLPVALANEGRCIVCVAGGVKVPRPEATDQMIDLAIGDRRFRLLHGDGETGPRALAWEWAAGRWEEVYGGPVDPARTLPDARFDKALHAVLRQSGAIVPVATGDRRELPPADLSRPWLLATSARTPDPDPPERGDVVYVLDHDDFRWLGLVTDIQTWADKAHGPYPVYECAIWRVEGGNVHIRGEGLAGLGRTPGFARPGLEIVLRARDMGIGR